VNVDTTVWVLPTEFVVVIVLTAPDSVVVLVKVEPALLVPIITTGITFAKLCEGPLDAAVALELGVLGAAVWVTVDGDPTKYIVFPPIVAGYTTVMVVPLAVVVIVTVVWDGIAEPEFAGTVTVVVA